MSWCLPLRAETHILYECAVFVIWKLASYEDVIRLERNDAMMLRWMWHLRPENTIFYEKLNNNRPKLNSMKKCLQNRRLPWFRQLKRRQDCLTKKRLLKLVVIHEELFWPFKPCSKLKTTFCKYWTSVKIKSSMTCVYKKYEVKIKMVQEQWLQLKAKNEVFIGL